MQGIYLQYIHLFVQDTIFELMWLCLIRFQKDTTKNITQVNIPGRLGPGDVWEPMP